MRLHKPISGDELISSQCSHPGCASNAYACGHNIMLWPGSLDTDLGVC